MKNFALMFSLIFCATIFLGCNDDEPVIDSANTLPAEALDVYTGALTYTSSTGEIITTLNGTASISISGNKYDITFSDDVPAISGLSFVESNGAYATTSDSNVTGISIDGDDLSVASSQNGNNWAFNGSK